MELKNVFAILMIFFSICEITGKNITYDIEKMGLLPEKYSNYSPVISEIITKIRSEAKENDNIVLKFTPGKYYFNTDGTEKKDYSISNHDYLSPRNIAIDISEINHLTIDGQGAEFIFDGRIIPIAANGCRDLTLKNFSIDFKHPQIIQFEIVNNLGNNGIIYYLAPWTNYDIDNKSGKLLNKGYEWVSSPEIGLIFDRDSKKISYNTTDIHINIESSDSIESRIIESPYWRDSRLKPGMTIVGRNSFCPSPGIFLSSNKDTHIEEVTIHYADGYGLLAQKCENISLQKFNVVLRSKSDLRCFTTHAGATMFSDCKGIILSNNGVYENMMNEAINVHGTYLAVTSVSEDKMEIHAKNMNGHSFSWGDISDSVSFISSKNLDIIHKTSITDISSDGKSNEFIIKLSSPFPSGVVADSIVIENTTWTPVVEFSNNVIRNNRGRGCQFSTPKKVLIKDNLFSHVSGCAIHIYGDCYKSYESGACRDVFITKNRFIDVLTSMFNFSTAIIVISPECQNFEKTFHHGIVIEDNYFETFDRPIVFARSVDGLYFKKNIIYGDTRYKPLNSNTYSFNLTKVLDLKIEDNNFSGYKFNEKEDIYSH